MTWLRNLFKNLCKGQRTPDSTIGQTRKKPTSKEATTDSPKNCVCGFHFTKTNTHYSHCPCYK